MYLSDFAKTNFEDTVTFACTGFDGCDVCDYGSHLCRPTCEFSSDYAEYWCPEGHIGLGMSCDDDEVVDNHIICVKE